MTNKINNALVSSYVSRFSGRYLTVKKLKTLSQRQRQIHFNNHWNILLIDNDMICLSYLNGGNGNIEKTLSSIPLYELNEIVFIPWEDNFVLFKYYNGQLKVKYTSLTLRMLENITSEHRFFAENGFKIKRKVLNLSNNNITYDEVELN